VTSVTAPFWAEALNFARNAIVRLRLRRAAARRPGSVPAPTPPKTRSEKLIWEETKVATISSTPSPVQHNQFAIATPEQPVMSPEQMDASAESAILRAATISIIGGAVLLGSISMWLWYGLHHYQNCL
jgi:hypothetical protein